VWDVKADVAEPDVLLDVTQIVALSHVESVLNYVSQFPRISPGYRLFKANSRGRSHTNAAQLYHPNYKYMLSSEGKMTVVRVALCYYVVSDFDTLVLRT